MILHAVFLTTSLILPIYILNINVYSHQIHLQTSGFPLYNILRILAMKDLTKSTYVTVCKTRILILYESSAFLFRRRFDHRCIIHDNTSQDISSLTVFVHIFGIDLADLALAIYIILIDIPGRTAPQPAG